MRDLGVELRKVLKTDEVDLLDLNAASPPLARAGVSGTLLLERDPVERTRFVEQTLLRYMDTAFLGRELLAGLKSQLGMS